MSICFFVTILKFVNGFSKGTIFGISSTIGSNQDHSQDNVYVLAKLKLFNI